ncbi:MAG: response regulator [Magnetospirillum sp. WYHS-4]
MKRALIVDDNPFHVSLMHEILTALNFKVAIRDDPDGVVEQVIAEPPDLLVMDVRLPGISGLRLVRRIKDTEGLGALPVLVVTALPFKEDDSDIRDSGADAFLEKPFDPAAFIMKVRELVA